MTARTRHIIHGSLVLLGLVLMVGGIVTELHGATVIGLIVAAASAGAWQRWRNA